MRYGRVEKLSSYPMAPNMLAMLILPRNFHHSYLIDYENEVKVTTTVVGLIAERALGRKH